MTSRPSTDQTLRFEILLPQPVERIWRVLTKSWLIEQWLMSNDFAPEVGRRFELRASAAPGRSGLTRCEVLTVEPPRRLAWRWGDGTAAGGTLRTIVTWTLDATDGGTLLRLEQAGFRVRDESAREAMHRGWPRVLERLAEVVAEGR
jgi:uncharacterized protein YndB with AHSA1/START domain